MSELLGNPVLITAELDAQAYFASLAKMAAELGRTATAHDQAGASAGSFGKATDDVGNKLTSAVTKGTLYAEVLGKIKDGLLKALKHSADYEDVVGKEEAAIVSLRQASAGLASDIDIQKAKQRLLQGDFSMTTRELEAMAKAAVYHSRVNETSLAASFDKVADVIQKGGRGLKEFGSTLETTGTDANKTSQVIDHLTKRFGGMSFQAENTNERIDVLKHSFGTIVGSIGSAILQSDLFSGALKKMSATAREIADGWANARDPGVRRQVELQDRIAEIRKKLAAEGADERGRLGPVPEGNPLDRLGAFDDVSRKRRATELASELSRIQEEFTSNRLRREREASKRNVEQSLADAKAASDRVNTLMEAAARARKPASGKKGEDKEWKAWEELSRWNGQVDKELADTRRARTEKAQAAELAFEERRQKLLSDNARVVTEEAERQQKLREAGLKWSEEQQEKLRARFGAWNGMDLAEKFLGKESYNALLQRLDQVGVAGQAAAEVYITAFGGMRDALGDAIGAVISGEKSAGEAAQGALHAFLSTWGTKMGMRALEEAAEAVAALARWDLASAGQHGIAMAMFGAAAAAAGLGAAVTKPQEKKQQTTARGTDRGLGGSGGAANRNSGGNATFVFNINTITTDPDQAALFVANASARAKAMGYRLAA